MVASPTNMADMSATDVLQIHFWDPFTPPEETMRALHDLVQSGKVRYIGASNLKTWQLAEMTGIAERNGWTTFVSVQVEHSLLYRNEVGSNYCILPSSCS